MSIIRRATSPFLIVNGFPYPVPDRGGFQYIITTTVGDARNANNEVVGNRVGRDQYKFNGLTWSILDGPVWERMLQDFDNFIINVEFYDPVRGERIGIPMYVGNRTFSPYKIDSNGKPLIYEDCACNFIDTGGALL